MDDSRKEIQSLVREKKGIEEKLISAGGKDYKYLLENCLDLSDIIDEIEDVSIKRSEKRYADISVRIKLSRKARHKVKDLNKFDLWLVKEYEDKHITLEQGKKMGAIIGFLRLNNMEKAKREAEEFYELLEMSERLEIINETLSKKRMGIERSKRSISTQLSGLEWLENEPPPDLEKVGRYDEKTQLMEKLANMWANQVQSLKSTPLEGLLKKMGEERLEQFGFPQIPSEDAESMGAFLRKSNLESKSAEQLYEMTEQNESRLRHTGLDLAGFKQQVVARKGFLSDIMLLRASDFSMIKEGSPLLTYLSRGSEEAQKAVERLAELWKTAEEDEMEWKRAERIGQKKAELAGVKKSALNSSLRELEALEVLLDGKVELEKQEETKKEKGIVESILDFLKP